MNNFDEIEKRHYEQYETDPEYRAKFDAESARRVTELERLENQQSRARNEAGHYTLEEAARFIADNSNSIYSSILSKLKESADAGKLPFYAPNSNEVFKKRTAVLGWREEVFYDDLNEWLKNNETRLRCSFPKPENVNSDYFDRRLAILKRWLIAEDYSLANGIVTLRKGLDHKKVHIALNAISQDKALFDLTLDSFKRYFWQKQKIAKLRRGR